MQAGRHLDAGELAKAEPLIKEVLKRDPLDVTAILMLADLATRLERYEDACNLLERCLELAPNFTRARQDYASVLRRVQRHTEALT